jgi:tetratricopeptide (TPR) repeat protein
LCLLGIGLLLLACLERLLAGQDFGAAFEQANKLYEQGNYTAAAAAYEALLATGHVSAALYFNLGNAWFKAGELGRAIAHYRLAERLTPRDPDVQANLTFARQSVAGRPYTPGRWERWLRRVTLNEATIVLSILLWSWLGLLTGGYLWPQRLRAWRTATLVCGLAAGLAALWLGLILHVRTGATIAIVTAPSAVVHYGPLEESQSAFTARDGMELEVRDQKDDWLQVTDQQARVGWIEARNVLVLPSELHGSPPVQAQIR